MEASLPSDRASPEQLLMSTVQDKLDRVLSQLSDAALVVDSAPLSQRLRPPSQLQASPTQTLTGLTRSLGREAAMVSFCR